MSNDASVSAVNGPDKSISGVCPGWVEWCLTERHMGLPFRHECIDGQCIERSLVHLDGEVKRLREKNESLEQDLSDAGDELQAVWDTLTEVDPERAERFLGELSASWQEAGREGEVQLHGRFTRIERILWNHRDEPGRRGSIDEVVLSNVNVHIEQMNDSCWWIGLYRPDNPDVYWMGNFHPENPNSRTKLTFTEQENAGIEWDRDESHVR